MICRCDPIRDHDTNSEVASDRLKVVGNLLAGMEQRECLGSPPGDVPHRRYYQTIDHIDGVDMVTTNNRMLLEDFAQLCYLCCIGWGEGDSGA